MQSDLTQASTCAALGRGIALDISASANDDGIGAASGLSGRGEEASNGEDDGEQLHCVVWGSVGRYVCRYC